MWNSAIASAPSYYGHQAPPTAGGGGAPSSNTNPNAAAAAAVAAATSSGQKHDIFVGNLAFATTEEQLYAAFSELGQIIKIRMVSDLETGKPRGFAFVEFADPQAALSAIRNMNDYEINGRKLRVNFSNSSHLETLANQLGMDLTQHVGGGNKNRDVEDSNNNAAGGAGGMMGNAAGGVGGHANAGGAGGGEGMMSMGGGVAGSKAVASALKSMNKGEMYDIVAKLKEIADTNPDEARKLLTQHPQLPEAILYCMSEVCFVCMGVCICLLLFDRRRSYSTTSTTSSTLILTFTTTLHIIQNQQYKSLT
jgi:cleavage stimulation factor subunit 2